MDNKTWLRSGRQGVQDAQTDGHPLHGGAGCPVRYHAVLLAAGAREETHLRIPQNPVRGLLHRHGRLLPGRRWLLVKN